MQVLCKGENGYKEKCIIKIKIKIFSVYNLISKLITYLLNGLRLCEEILFHLITYN